MSENQILLEDRKKYFFLDIPFYRTFPQSLEITKCGDFTHSHRTTTNTHYDDNLALQKRRRFSFAPTGL